MAISIIEVNSPHLEKEFLLINASLNKSNPNYIRPLDNEVNQVFDRSHNKLFKAAMRPVQIPSAFWTIHLLASPPLNNLL